MDKSSLLNDGKITFVPNLRNSFDVSSSNKERKPASVLESLYWQSIGWVHTPPFLKEKPESSLTFMVPKSDVHSEKYKYYTKRSFEPKLQIEDRVPYGTLPKDVASDLEKRKFSQQDFQNILEEMGIEKEAMLPQLIFYKDGIEILREHLDDTPFQSFLELNTFDDDWLYDIRSAEEWLSLGNTENGRKPIPAAAFVPRKEDGCLKFHWYDVSVFDYDSEKRLYRIRQNAAYQTDNSSLQDVNNTADMWIPRIYLKFDAEEPFQFAKRLQTAISTRRLVEESLRMNYYVECMPLNNTPEWPREDLNMIIEKARRSRQLQKKFQWITDYQTKIIDELQLQYKRAYNYVCYTEITKQNPSLVKDFKNEYLIIRDTNINPSSDMRESFTEMVENFKRKTFYTCVEVVRALNLIEEYILVIRDKSLYNLPLKAELTLGNFETLHKTEISNISKYIHEVWLLGISEAILQNLEKCGKGLYDLNQTNLYTFKLTKLGKFLKMVAFKMQDVIRYLVTESLEKYALLFQRACFNIINVKDNFTWTSSLKDNNQFSPLENPVFLVPLEIKGDKLQSAINLEKYAETVKDLFEEGLRVTQDLPKIEKFVMKKMLYNPDEKLDTVGEKEKNVVRWKMDITRGIDRAIVVTKAYIRAYDVPLQSIKTDQINYVKQLARKKATCDQLKQVIEMHNNEKINLENEIPAFVDIGPFRLMTRTVRQAVIKKHEQLADAVLEFFFTKLRQQMEQINNQFLMLLDRVDQPTGNIEDLLDKKQWCRTVPKKIERLCTDVNKLRSDMKLISTLYRNLDDGDFFTFWQIQKLPQETMKRLKHQTSVFEDERIQHRRNLDSDQEKLKENLTELCDIISKFEEHSELEKVSVIATDVRKARKSLIKFEEQSQLYQKRERLFGLPITNYDEIHEISELLAPYENFWLSTAEFKKYDEREDADLLLLDPTQLRENIEEFHLKLLKSLDFFTEESYPEIHKSVVKVLENIQEFLASRLSQNKI